MAAGPRFRKCLLQGPNELYGVQTSYLFPRRTAPCISLYVDRRNQRFSVRIFRRSTNSEFAEPFAFFPTRTAAVSRPAGVPSRAVLSRSKALEFKSTELLKNCLHKIHSSSALSSEAPLIEGLMVSRPAGLEPTTHGLEIRCSIRLS